MTPCSTRSTAPAPLAAVEWPSVVARIWKAAVNGFLWAFAVTALYPPLWMIYNSLKTSAEFALNIFALPAHPQLSSYARILRQGQIYRATLNSAFASVTSIILTVILSFVVAYFLARYRFRGRDLLYLFFLFGLLVPVHALLVPIFIQFRLIGMLNKQTTLILPFVAFNMPTSIFLIESYVRAIPVEIEEAAFIDGAGLNRTLATVVFPMCAPIIATVVILSFLGTWNAYAFPLVLLRDTHLKTVPLWLSTFYAERTVDYPGLMAALFMASLPQIIVYVAFREQIMNGMIAGALRG